MNTNEFKFYCSHCDQPLSCDPRFAGQKTDCPRCLNVIRIPNPPADATVTSVTPESGRTWNVGFGALNPPGS